MEVAWGRREARQSLPVTVHGHLGSRQACEMGKMHPKGHRGRKKGYGELSGKGGTHVEVLTCGGKLRVVFPFAGVRCWQSCHRWDKRAGGL